MGSLRPSDDPDWNGMYDPTYQPQQALTIGFMCMTLVYNHLSLLLLSQWPSLQQQMRVGRGVLNAAGVVNFTNATDPAPWQRWPVHYGIKSANAGCGGSDGDSTCVRTSPTVYYSITNGVCYRGVRTINDVVKSTWYCENPVEQGGGCVCGVWANTHHRRMSVCESVAAAGGAQAAGDGMGGGVAPGWRPELARFVRRG